MSLIAATADTKKNASPTPKIARATMNIGSVVTNRCSASAPTVREPPTINSGRRPNRSDAQPTTGRKARAATEKTPIAIPTPAGSAPSGPAANRDDTGSTVFPAVKNPNAAIQRRRNPRLKSGGRTADVSFVTPPSDRSPRGGGLPPRTDRHGARRRRRPRHRPPGRGPDRG